MSDIITPPKVLHPISARVVEILTHESKRPIGATLLTGGWGSGKTYIWLNEIEPTLNARELKPVYVSLFGATSPDDIRSKLISSWVKRSTKGFGADKVFEGIEKLGVLTSAAGFLKKATGVDLGAVKIDLIPFLKEQTIICFDDLERASVHPDITLGFINYLVEHKKCRILLIANEDTLRSPEKGDKRSLYESYKEKVIWTSLSYNPSPAAVYDIFVNDLKDGETKKKVQTLKDLVLDMFRAGAWENLRTLQRVLRYLAEVFDACPVEVPEGAIRFLVALLIEDARKGLRDAETYNWIRYHIMSYNDKKKVEELEGDERIAYEFYTRYCEDRPPPSKSQAIYDFVKSGILDAGALKAEITPEDNQPKTEDQKILREIRDGGWFFASDADKQAFMKRILGFLRGKEPASAYAVLTFLKVYFSFVDQTKAVEDPGLSGLANVRLKDLAQAGDRSLEMPGGFEFETQFQQQKVEPFLRYFQSELQKTRVDTSAQTIKSWFDSKDHKYGLADLEISKPLMLAALDPVFMNEADAKVSTDPMLFHGYYRSVLKGLNSGANDIPLSIRRKAAQEITDRLSKLAQSGKLDHSGVIRLNDLVKRIPQFPVDPGPAPEPAAATPAPTPGSSS